MRQAPTDLPSGRGAFCEAISEGYREEEGTYSEVKLDVGELDEVEVVREL